MMSKPTIHENPFTPEELAWVWARYRRCTFPSASFPKRFARNDVGRLSSKGRNMAASLAYQFRRQIFGGSAKWPFPQFVAEVMIETVKAGPPKGEARWDRLTDPELRLAAWAAHIAESRRRGEAAFRVEVQGELAIDNRQKATVERGKGRTTAMMETAIAACATHDYVWVAVHCFDFVSELRRRFNPPPQLKFLRAGSHEWRGVKGPVFVDHAVWAVVPWHEREELAACLKAMDWKGGDDA